VKHRMQAPTPELVAETRISVLEKLAHDLSVSLVKAGVEHDAQAAIIRRRNEDIVVLSELLRRQVLAYAALARVRDTARPARVWDTGTPGVHVGVTR
jgi:arginine deiminase